MFKGKTSLLQNNDSCFSCPNVSFIWKDILHTYNHDVFVSKKYYIHPGFYFIVMFFFVSLHDFQSNGSLPCEASSAHTCTNTFFKEYHNRKELVLTGLILNLCCPPSQRSLFLCTPTLYTCKSL